MTRFRAHAAAVLALLLVVRGAAQQGQQARAAKTSPFGHAVETLSEQGGYFDTDNLISNESSYLQVVPELKRRSVRGGVYIGVGPDQNFSYIAATRPAIAYIVDIRRDNVLLHLLFKALFQQSRTRVEYLSQLFGRAVPADPQAWRDVDVDRLAAYVGAASLADVAALHSRVERVIGGFGVTLSLDDRRRIAGFHQRFIDAGLGLRFQSAGRPPQWNYPSYGDMLVDRDGSGRQAHFLASEDDFQFLRDLQARDLVIPVVGDLSGTSAMANVARAVAARGDRLTAFYVSNVEFYLFREGSYARFTANLRAIPRSANAVVIRSFFQRAPVAPARRDDNSVSQVASIEELLRGVAEGRIRNYSDLAGAR